MTDMTDIHTCSARGVDLLMAMVPVMDGEYLQVTGDMVQRTCI